MINQLFIREKESYCLLSGISLIWILVIWLFDPAYMMFSFDDSFYYLKVASNIVSGFGVTFDRINTTNGFHPLWIIVTSAVTALLGDHSPVVMRTLLTLQVAMVYLGTHMLAMGTPVQGRTIVIVTAVLLTNFYCTKIVVNGQESALQYLFMCLALKYWWLFRESSNFGVVKKHLIIGLIAGMTALSRIDAVVFSAVLIAMPFLWPGESEAPKVWERLRDSGIRLVTFLLVVTPYVFWNLDTQGHILPVSAAVKIDWRPSVDALTTAAFAAAICLLLVIYWQRGKHATRGTIIQEGVCFAFPVLVYAAGESVASFWMSGAFMPPLWYMPPYFVLLIIGITIFAKVCDHRRVSVILIGMAGLYLFIAAGLAHHRFDFRSYSYLLAYREAGRWLDSHTGSNSLVASWDAGIMAAHSHRRFINLDGLISSWDYKINYLDKGLTEKFINEVHRVDYICQGFDSDVLRTPIYRGVNLSGFYVAWFECVEHHQLINFLRKGVDGDKVWSNKAHYAVILSRKPIHGDITFSQFVSEVSKGRSRRCLPEDTS